MKNFLKNNIKLLFGIIIGIIISGFSVYASILLNSNEVSIDNTNMQLKNADNTDVTTVQEAVEALNRNLKAKECALGYDKENAADYSYGCRTLCKRVTDATKLHTEECTNSSTSAYCKADGYVAGNLGTTITYGNAKALNTQLAVGDAFDCDINGNGVIDVDANNNSTERFYYVSEYFNTDTKTFDDSTGYATLIYYRNFVSGSPNDGEAEYNSSNQNYNGPVTALTHLPTASTWSNITLKATSRAILGENNSTHNTTMTSGGSLPTSFSYAGKVARLLTAQELMRGCGLNQVGGTLSTNCRFLFELTKYADSSKATYGSWLETPDANSPNYVWYVYVHGRSVGYRSANSVDNGVRPVIDVPYSEIAF